jgi:hypothetical protein
LIGKKELILAAIILLSIIRLSPADEGLQTLTAEGVGIVVGEDRAAARDRAINDALRNAVKQAVETVVSSERATQRLATLKNSIYDQSKAYIQYYKILSENQGPNLHTVTLQATIDMGILEKDLELNGIIQKQSSRAGILLLIAEKNIGQERYSYWWGVRPGEEAASTIAERTISDQLRQRGVPVLASKPQGKNLQIPLYDQAADLSDQGAITIGREAGAEIVIVGSATARAVGFIGGTPMMSALADISLRAIDTTTGKILSRIREQAAALHSDEITAGSESIQKASIRIVEKMIPNINENISEKPAPAGTVELTVHGLSGIEDLRRFKKMLHEQIPGVKRIQEKSFSEKTIQMDVSIEGDAQSWIDVLSRTSVKEFSLITVRSSGNSIELIVTPR